MSDLLALAERCEEAAGPDRELDAALWWETHQGSHTDPELRPAFEADPAKALDEWCGAGWRHEFQFPPRYTVSLDAAMTLVPKDWVESYYRRHDGTARAECRAGGILGLGPLLHQGEGAIPALAMCAAAIRARATV